MLDVAARDETRSIEALENIGADLGGAARVAPCGEAQFGAGDREARGEQRFIDDAHRGRCLGDAVDDGDRFVASARGGDAREAVAGLRLRLPVDSFSAILVFFSPNYEPKEFAAEMAAQFPGEPVYGCTTAGELTPEGIVDGGVVALGFRAGDFTIVAQPVADLDGFTFERIRDHVGESRARLEQAEDGAERRNRFGLLLVDGMSLHEEALISAISACLDDIQVVGGSAGDGMNFGATWVIFDGKAHCNAAVLLLVSTEIPCRLFKCNSFEPTSTKLVVTEADIEKRIVHEINAEPAAHEYARIIGVPYSELNGYTFAAHPVIVRVDGDYYARSIQRANEDGSLTFFCAIDEGLVLTAAGRLDTLGVVEDMFRATEAELGEVSLYLGFDCLHRRLDAEQRQITRELADLYRRHNVVGFNTYGEQYRSMHLNQTFSGLAIGRRAEPR